MHVSVDVSIDEKLWLDQEIDCTKDFLNFIKESYDSDDYQNLNYQIGQKINIDSYIIHLIKATFFQAEFNKLFDANCEAEFSVMLTNDKIIKDLNNNYRFIDKSTNVLSFPLLNNKDFNSELLKQRNFVAFGDVVLSFETIKKESIENNKKMLNHLTHLVIHGLLHLMGYDHKIEKEAEIMENMEIKLLKKLAIDNPYK